MYCTHREGHPHLQRSKVKCLDGHVSADVGYIWSYMYVYSSNRNTSNNVDMLEPRHHMANVYVFYAKAT